MSTLYEIDAAMTALIDEDTGEITDYDAFEALVMEKDKKCESIALLYLNYLSDAEQYKTEKKKFEERAALAARNAERLKSYLDRFLAGEKFKTTRVNVSYRRSEGVVIDDAKDIAEKYIKYTPSYDVAGIKAAIKSGETVTGAHLEERKNIQIR